MKGRFRSFKSKSGPLFKIKNDPRIINGASNLRN